MSRYSRAVDAFFIPVLCVALVLVPLAWSACSSPAAKTAEQIAVRIGDDVCTEEAKQPADPGAVALLCLGESLASGALASSAPPPATSPAPAGAPRVAYAPGRRGAIALEQAPADVPRVHLLIPRAAWRAAESSTTINAGDAGGE